MPQLSKFPQWNTDTVTNKKVVIYSLNCVTSSPETSHPARYWKRDNGKLLKLFNEARAKGADLILLNYSKTSDFFKSMKVVNATKKGIKTVDFVFKGMSSYNTFIKELGLKYKEIL
jgi:hypothetical protein